MNTLQVRYRNRQDYQGVYAAMIDFSGSRLPSTPDQVWFLEHDTVYTLGMAGKHEHILDSGNIPVIQTDRGGQVTYHGPGQLVVYLLVDLKRKGLGIKQYVSSLEQIVIDLLEIQGIAGQRRAGAPGVYVDDRKIAALGVRVRRGCCYHGLALNVNMDLLPFQRINPCGYPGLEVTQLADFGVDMSLEQVAERLLPLLISRLGYADCDIIEWSGNRELSEKLNAK